jgi:hypothetical protein
MKRLIYFITTALFAVCWYGCTKEGRIDHLDSKAPAPAQISNVKINEVPGGAVLTYTIPKDPNLSYVKAVYEIQPGVVREAKASYYTDTLRLVGFGDTLSHEVQLFSVGKNEKESASISVKVKPLSPPVRTVFKTLKLTATFGGVNVSFVNDSRANLAIVVIVDTTGLGTWAPVTTFYTGAPEGSFSARGYDTTKRTFAVYIRDRWDNKSDTLAESLTPLFEQFIDPDTFKALELPNDTWQGAEAIYSVENLWDGIYHQSYHGSFASTNSSTLPQWFTIDLGKKVILSRFKEFQMDNFYIYQGAAVESFEIWGSNNPDKDGGWNNWIKLGAFHSFKPSGLPLGQVSADDINYAAVNGEDFEFTDPVPAVRYIRFKTLQTYSSSGQIFICELKFWGQIVP